MATTSTKVKQRLESAIASLPAKKLEQLLDFAEFLRSREDWEATLELTGDAGMLRDVTEGRSQATRGEGRSWRNVKKPIRG
jgi:hypothetical protein